MMDLKNHTERLYSSLNIMQKKLEKSYGPIPRKIRTDRRKDGRTDRQTGGRTDGRADGRTTLNL